MTAEKLFELIGEVKEEYLRDSEKHSVCLPFPKKKKGFRIGRYTLPYAAAIIILLCVCSISVVATAGLLRRQEELRQSLGIEGATVPEYTEYDITPVQGPEVIQGELRDLQVHVISGVRDEQMQTWYFTVSPVSREIAERYSWYVGGYAAFPYIAPGSEMWGDPDWPFSDAVHSRYYIEDAYDEETQSLLLVTDRYLPIDGNGGSYPDPEDPERVTRAQTHTVRGGIQEFSRHEDSDGWVVGDFTEYWRAEAVFTPSSTDLTELSVSFGDGIPLRNEESGETGTILGLTIQAGGLMKLHYTYPDVGALWGTEAEGLRNEENNLRITSWIRSLGGITMEMTLHYANGNSHTGFGGITLSYQDGVVTEYMRLRSVLDLNEIVAVTIAGQRYEVH